MRPSPIIRAMAVASTQSCPEALVPTCMPSAGRSRHQGWLRLQTARSNRSLTFLVPLNGYTGTVCTQLLGELPRCRTHVHCTCTRLDQQHANQSMQYDTDSKMRIGQTDTVLSSWKARDANRHTHIYRTYPGAGGSGLK